MVLWIPALLLFRLVKLLNNKKGQELKRDKEIK